MPNFISEDQLERALLQKLQHVHGYDILDRGTDDREDLADGSGHSDKREVFLFDRLRTAPPARQLRPRPLQKEVRRRFRPRARPRQPRPKVGGIASHPHLQIP